MNAIANLGCFLGILNVLGTMWRTSSAQTFVEVQEGSSQIISCNDTHPHIIIDTNCISARYMETYAPDGTLSPTFCQGADVSSMVGFACNYKKSCKLFAGRKDLGDPCGRNIKMRLVLTYTCSAFAAPPEDLLQNSPCLFKRFSRFCSQ